MKAGTTSLHYALAAHRDIFIPCGEIGFFDADDFIQHPDFFVRRNGEWRYHDFDRYGAEYLDVYRDYFGEASNDQVVGEDSTTYLASRIAPSRIRDMNPGVKLIFLLREPVSRAYSHYWHLIRRGYVSGTFEDVLLKGQSNVVQRGCYRVQLQRYLSEFPPEQIKVVLFENFVEDIQGTVEEILRFLGIDAGFEVPEDRRHMNPSRYPLSLHFQGLVNSILFRHCLGGSWNVGGHLPELTYEQLGYSNVGKWLRQTFQFAHKALTWCNCRLKGKPDLAPATARMLRQIYQSENAGLSRLLGCDLASVWGYAC